MSLDPIRNGARTMRDVPSTLVSNHCPTRRFVRRVVFDALRMVRTTFSPGLTFRDAELVKDAVDSFAFLISQSKNIEIVHGHRKLRLAQADATLLSD